MLPCLAIPPICTVRTTGACVSTHSALTLPFLGPEMRDYAMSPGLSIPGKLQLRFALLLAVGCLTWPVKTNCVFTNSLLAQSFQWCKRCGFLAEPHRTAKNFTKTMKILQKPLQTSGAPSISSEVTSNHSPFKT